MEIKKKLRDLTENDYDLIEEQYCNVPQFYCDNCPLSKVPCRKYDDNCWIKNKKLYSDEFLNQEIVFETELPSKRPVLTRSEKNVLENVDSQWKYIARNASDGDLRLYKQKPTKKMGYWGTFNGEHSDFPFSSQFCFIAFEDDEPYSIDFLLRKKHSNE